MQHEVEYAFSHKFCDFLLKRSGIPLMSCGKTHIISNLNPAIHKIVVRSEPQYNVHIPHPMNSLHASDVLQQCTNSSIKPMPAMYALNMHLNCQPKNPVTITDHLNTSFEVD
jgi:hypothetical protein